MANVCKFILLIAFLLPTISALNITLDYPEKIQPDSEQIFTLKIIDGEEDFYDVKIDIVNTQLSRIARIWNGEKYASTMYYIKNITQTEKQFKIQFNEYEGDATILVKLRHNNEVVSFPVYFISIDSSYKSTEQEEIIEVEESKEKEEKTVKEESTKKTKKEEQSKEPQKENEIIVLNSKSIKEEIKDEESSNFHYYPILFFSILLGVLYKVNSKKRKTEFN